MSTPLRHHASAMRALAHPTRLALLEILQLHPSLTATEAGELIGETPTNCAFHLRALGRFGFVEEVGGGVGRRRPWRVRQSMTAFSDVQNDGQTTQAARALSDVVIHHWLDRIAAVQSRRHLQSAEWQEVLGGSQSIAFTTLAEAAELIEEIRVLMRRYNDRLAESEKRPADGKAIELLLFAQAYEPV